MTRRRLPSFLSWLIVLLLALCLGLVAACSDDDDPVTPPSDEPGEPGDDIHVDDGYVGLVLDTRPIFRRGYVPAQVEITFADHTDRNATLPVDDTTNLAILSIDTDELVEGELEAFTAGVALTLVVRDGDGDELATHAETEQVLDNSNAPLVLTTSLPMLLPAVDLRGDLPYLIQREGYDGIFSGNYEEILPDEQYVEGDMAQQFVFVPVEGEDGTYCLQNPAEVDDYYWCWVEDGDKWLRYESSEWSTPAHLVPEADDDGWMRLRVAGTEQYLDYLESVPGAGNVLAVTSGDPGRFRLISDCIDWLIADRGTRFNQPIMPPARLDFAYRGTLRNCSASTLEETIGRTEQRSSTTTVGTSESLQLFAGATLSAQLTVGYSVTAKVGVDVEGIGEVGEEITQSAEVQVGASVTTSATTATQNTWSESVTRTTEVSRERTITVPPYSAVEVYDAVKTIANVRIPFTQVLRISGTNKDTDEPLTGLEVRSQMMFNFVGGVVTAVGDTYVDIGFRGEVTIDQLLHATTNVNELEGACD